MASSATGLRAGREVEIKLEFDPADRAAIQSHPLLAAVRPRSETLISVYFDTHDRALWKAKWALRVRKIGSRYTQTLKGADGAADLFDRPEFEGETSKLTPDLALAAGTPLAAILNGAAAADLGELFRTRIERIVYQLPNGTAEIEVAIDQGEIEADAHWSPVHEVELELKRGTPADIFRLARRLAESIPLRLAVKTKAERGYDLAAGVLPGPEKVRPVVLDKGATCAEAFRVIGETCLRQIVVNEKLVGHGEAEALHQMRIGLRRLRAAIAVFAKMTADSEQEPIKSELRWITNALGPARDLDVFAADILKPLAKSDAHTDTQSALALARAKAYAAADESIRSDRFRNAMLDIAEWIEVGPWTTDDALAKRRERKVKRHAAKRLSRLRHELRDKGQDLRKLDAGKRHKLRIKAKTLRYAIEFFASLFPSGDRRRDAALSALKDMQDELGELNDLAQREALARETLGGNGLQAEAETLLAADGNEVEKRLKRAEAAYDRFAGTKAFWT